MQQFGRQAVGDVHHGGGLHTFFCQFPDDVTTGFRFQLPFQQILFACKIGLQIFVAAFEHALFTFQQLQSHVGGAQIAGDADKVGVFGAVAINHFALFAFTDAGDADGESRIGGRRIAAYNIHPIFLTGKAYAGIQFFHFLYAEALG